MCRRSAVAAVLYLVARLSLARNGFAAAEAIFSPTYFNAHLADSLPFGSAHGFDRLRSASAHRFHRSDLR
jgi:hypothetical protein